MSILIDVLIVAIILINIFMYARKGLVRVAIDIAGFILSALVAWYFSPMVGGYVAGMLGKAITGEKIGLFASILSIEALSRIIAFALVFALCMIIVKLIVKLTKDIRIPIISTVDKVLGGVLGLILGLAWAQIASMVVFALGGVLINVIPGFPADALEGLTVTKWFFEVNLFKTIFAAL